MKTPCSTCFIKFHEATLIYWNTGWAVLLTYYHFGQAHKPYSWMIPSRKTTVGLILFQDTVNATMMKLFIRKNTQGVSFLTCLPSDCGEGQRRHLDHPAPAPCQIPGTEGVLNVQRMNDFFFFLEKQNIVPPSSPAPRLPSASHSIYSPAQSSTQTEWSVETCP